MHRSRLLHTAILSSFLAAASLVAASSACAADAQGDIRDCLRGQDLQQKNSLDEAISAYSTCLNTGGLDPVLKASMYVSRGNAYEKNGQLDKAEDDFTSAIKLDPMLSTAFNNRANLLKRSGKYELAVADYTKAISLSPKNDVLYSNRGNAYKTMKRYAEAIADYDKAISLKPADPAPYYNRACLEAQRRNTAEACAWLEKSFDRGFSTLGLLKNDPDLEPIRDAECYKKLLQSK
jgi:tetratricopeptide (TPR) repeat protein